MYRKAPLQTLPWLAACLLCLPVYAQTTAALPAFESASIKPAPADAPTAGLGFMIALGKQAAPRGLLTMTSPLAPFIMFAYDVQDEIEARAMRSRLPEWSSDDLNGPTFTGALEKQLGLRLKKGRMRALRFVTDQLT